MLDILPDHWASKEKEKDMPTARLSEYDRNHIESEYNSVLRRALYNKPFPIPKDDMKQWGRSLLPQEVADRWLWLREHRPELAAEGSHWRGHFKIGSDTHLYSLNSDDVRLPFDGIFVPREHDSYSAVLEWTVWWEETREKVSMAEHWLSKCIYQCHSVGQIKRVLGEEIIRFVPNSLARTLKHSERQSRIPRGLNIDADKHELLCNMLTLGSISPEKVPEPDVTVESVEELEKE